MQLDYDEEKWPDLGRFRRACLAERLDEMEAIAHSGVDWYRNENPDRLPMGKLAKVFQAQHLASENSLVELKKLVAACPWAVNHPWTAQRWLPITQACAHGDCVMFEYLLSAGADPTLLVGDPGKEANAIDMAKHSGNDELAAWLQRAITDRE